MKLVCRRRIATVKRNCGFYRGREACEASGSTCARAMRVRRGAAVPFDRFVEQKLEWRRVDQLRCRKSPSATWRPSLHASPRKMDARRWMLSSFVRRRSIVAALSISSVRSAKQSTRTSTVGETENGFSATAIGSTYPCIKSSTSSVTSPDGFPETSWPLTKDIGPSCWEMRGFLSSASYTLVFFLNKQNLRIGVFLLGCALNETKEPYGMRPVSVIGLACLVVAIAGTRFPG